ncbi:hypothetical protein KAR48_05060 [bacterium]|nr:hypothetical protein [bacterium]
MRKFLFFTLLLILITISSSCIYKKQTAVKQEIKSEKIDLWLQKDLKKAGKNDLIHFFIVCNHKPSNMERREIEEKGVVINTVAGKMLTAQATKEQIKALTGLSYVKYLEGSKLLKPKKQ